MRVNQPVVNGDGLVGKVTDVTGNSAEVTLITDHTSGVSARVLTANGSQGPYGVLQTEVGKPDDLLLDLRPAAARTCTPGDRVVTAGTVSSRKDLASLFPPGIPIGRVTRVDDREPRLDQRVHVKPYADLRHARLRPGPHQAAARPARPGAVSFSPGNGRSASPRSAW